MGLLHKVTNLSHFEDITKATPGEAGLTMLAMCGRGTYEGDWSSYFSSDPPVPSGPHPGHLVFQYDAYFVPFKNPNKNS